MTSKTYYYVAKRCVHWDARRNIRFRFYRKTGDRLEVYDGEKGSWGTSPNNHVPIKRDMTRLEIEETTQRSLF